MPAFKRPPHTPMIHDPLNAGFETRIPKPQRKESPKPQMSSGQDLNLQVRIWRLLETLSKTRCPQKSSVSLRDSTSKETRGMQLRWLCLQPAKTHFRHVFHELLGSYLQTIRGGLPEMRGANIESLSWQLSKSSP